jgi:menaquinone-dependent protoporphyrinogen IX oxidase
MKKVLVAYATMAGSTLEVAQAVGEEFTNKGFQADVLPVREIESLQGYDGVVVGGPMIMGWHREARRFLRKHRKEFSQVPLAVFVLAISLTRTGEIDEEGDSIVVDEDLSKPPKVQGELSFRERYAQLDKYLAPIVNATRPAKPVSIGVFGGRLEYGRLKWWAVLFVMLVIQAAAGDKRNWQVIRAWAAGLPELMKI